MSALPDLYSNTLVGRLLVDVLDQKMFEGKISNEEREMIMNSLEYVKATLVMSVVLGYTLYECSLRFHSL